MKAATTASLAIVFIAASAACHVSFAGKPSPDVYLFRQNQARKEVGIRDLDWNETLARFALDRLSDFVGTCKPKEMYFGPYGENLAIGTSESFRADDAVKQWLSEKPKYRHDINRCTAFPCGHYTQIVWRETTSVGCNTVKCKNGSVIIGCYYNPRGNHDNLSPYDLGPLSLLANFASGLRFRLNRNMN